MIGAGQELTFGRLAQRVRDQAAALTTLDPVPGSRVCVGAANTVEHLVSILAVLAAGKVWVPLNPRSGDPELRRLIEFVKPSVVLVDESLGGRVPQDGRTRLIADLPVGAGGPIAMGPVPAGSIGLDQTQAIKFTGGTTGTPKGVEQPLRAWTTNIVTQIHALGLTPADRYLVAAPLTHGTSTYVLPVFGSGGALVFPDEPGPAGLLGAAERHGATLVFAPPTLILALAEEQRRAPRNLGALRHLVYGGSPMRPEQIRAAQDCFGPVLCTSYGQTEAPQIATFLPPAEMSGSALASIGRPTIMTQVAILSADGVFLPSGQEGEIVIRGDLVMTGYLDMPDETARTFAGGWLRTGDAGAFDDRGLLFLKDRIRDVIITGGFNVYPGDVETALAAHPSVAECSVFGVPDAKWGEAVHAAVQVRQGHPFAPAELMALIKRELGPVKTPKEVHLFEKLPRTPVGKVPKRVLCEEVLRRREALVGERRL